MEVSTITKHRIIYVADDGREFDNEPDCLRYEESLKANITANTITHISENPPMSDEGYSYEWYYIENEREFDIFQKDILSDSSDINDDYCKRLLPAYLGICMLDGDDETIFAGSLGEYFSQVKEYVELLGVKLRFTCKGEPVK